MTSSLCFYHQLRVKLVCIHTGNNFCHIEQTHLRLPKCLWMFDTESNGHQIGILDNCLINDNFTNTLPTPLPEVKQYCI